MSWHHKNPYLSELFEPTPAELRPPRSAAKRTNDWIRKNRQPGETFWAAKTRLQREAKERNDNR